MRSDAKTVKEYLAELAPDRCVAIEAVRDVILGNLPEGYEETMQYGMIGYVVSLGIYPAGYLGDKTRPLPYASLASQKNHMAVYLMNVYGREEEWFRKAYAKTGKRLDMGKCCVRFKKLDHLPLELIGRAIAKTSVQEFIEIYEKSRRKRPTPRH